MQCKILAIALIFIGSSSVSSGQSCSAHYPTLAATPGGDDPTQSVGTWYIYRKHGEVSINSRITVTNLGATIEPLTNLTAYQLYLQSSWTTAANSTCQYEIWTGTYLINGMAIGNDVASRDGYSINHLIGNSILYHDYQKLMIGYGCMIPKTDGTCDTPVIWAETRTRPDQLSAGEMAAFDSIINITLQPYCVTTQDLPVQVYDDAKPSCPSIDPSSCMSTIIQGIKASVPSSNTTASVSSVAFSYSSPASTCHWPVYIYPKLAYDPQTVAGLWWVYRAAFDAEPNSVGMRYFWHILGSAPLPQTPLNGNYAWAEYTQYDNPNDTQCNYGYWTGMLVTTGQNVGFRFITSDSGDGIVPLRSMTIYQDDKYEFFYGCFIPNMQTQICASPFAMFSVRTDPTTWSQSEKDHVDNDIITPLIQSFGCAAKDMRIMPHPSDKAQCEWKGATPCLNQFIAGYNELLPPVHDVIY
ncbi:uncharacterized protein LOC129590027 [Paramacrobiotus metropolitanus]|uniref:uncharacterized protein LOC129590027 n=1 Tax=Paramacrobiotus metropolitanus TaxID=2943436 RepID=UPI002445C782|nr:uncharacterized protein LOC129590027 [Paramacrobiotus metropolitanus]